MDKRLTKGLLIDSERQEIRWVQFGGSEGLRELIGGWIEVAYSWDTGDVLYVDEEGLLKPQSHFFTIAVRRDGQPLPGNGVIVGREVEDDSPQGFHTLPPTLTVDELRSMVQFRSHAQAQSWAKANASEPSTTVTYIRPDGTVQSEVTSRFGEIYAQIPEKAPDYYVFDAEDYELLKMLNKALHGFGEVLTSDARRDLAQKMEIFLGRAVALRKEDLR